MWPGMDMGGRRWLWPLLAVVGLLGLALASQLAGPGGSAYTLRGGTMGTTYAVTVHGADGVAPERLQALIEERLAEINAAMSTWDDGSEISRFNRAPAGEPVPVGGDFRTVAAAALALSAATEGAFDPTVAPLVNLWGFGPEAREGPPPPAAIAEARRRVGWRKVSLDGGRLRKAEPGVALDLSGIAKGYGVDAVAGVVAAQGITDYLVEIGGEVRAAGATPGGDPWVVGVEEPLEGAPQGQSLFTRVFLRGGGALATSGSYRRFRRYRGRRSHHIIDPRTGRPTQLRLVSATVYAPDCMTADGIATALLVMGVERGLAWVARRQGVEALLISVKPDGGFERAHSDGFPRLERPR